MKTETENTLKQITKSLEETKQLLLKVIETSAGKEPTGAATAEKSLELEEMKGLLLKVIADQTSKARTSLSVMDSSEDEYSMAKCMKMIDRMDLSWPAGSFYHVSELLQEKGKREMFMGMSFDQRYDWIKDVKSQIRNP